MWAPLRCAYGARPVAARIHTRAGSRSAERRRLSRYSRARESVSAQRLLARLRIGSGAARHGGAVEWAEDASDVHNYPFRWPRSPPFYRQASRWTIRKLFGLR